MFGGCFAFNDVYRKMRGGGLKISMQFSFISAIAALVIMIIWNMFFKIVKEPTPQFLVGFFGLDIGFSWFTSGIALLQTLSGFAFTFCSFMALGKINLSLYSIFSMLGGMVLPFLQGIIFYREPITWEKVVCFILIVVALFVTLERDKSGQKKGGTIYYVGIFTFNGMSGVLATLFEKAPEPWKNGTNAAGLSIYSALFSLVLSSFILLVFLRKVKAPKLTFASTGICALSGVTNKIANYLLVIALMFVDASVQYPMITGGVMIVSTIISYIKRTKPSKRELISVAIAFVGLLLLFIVTMIRNSISGNTI
jgi:drug/metabolite transporter (DMT)-like permease